MLEFLQMLKRFLGGAIGLFDLFVLSGFAGSLISPAIWCRRSQSRFREGARVLHYAHGDEGLSSAIELNDLPCEVALLELVDVIHKIYS